MEPCPFAARWSFNTSLDLLLQPHPICVMGQYQSASTTFQADCSEKAFLHSLVSLFWSSHASSIISVSLLVSLRINDRPAGEM
jgi:hypothetical protein